MKPRSPTMWLGLSGCENNYDLIVSNRLRLVTSHLPRPGTQRPSLVVLVGGRAKSIALHAMFGVRIAQPATGSPGSNEIHLHLAPQTSFHERPVLLAEGHLYNSHARVVPTTCPQDARRQAIIWTAQSGLERRVTGELYCRLLAPFADVFCFFCDDLDGGLEGVAHHLATWLDHAPQAQSPANAHPKIVVVSSTVPHGVQGEAKAKTDLLAMLEKETRRETSNLSTYISFVTVLPHTSVSATARYRALKERIMRISDDVRQSRVDARCLFSATHVAALLDGACDHFASASDLPFDLVQESRRRNPVPENLESHVTEFVGRGTPQTELVTFAMPVIGSSLFLDAYPPGAHLFDPVEVFEGLYSDMLNRAFSNEPMPLGRAGSTCMPSDGLIQLVKAHFYGLSCGHVHCEACVWDYGRPSDDDPWVTLYGQCHLCDILLREEAVIRRHPPTAGVGVFCLDGGGVRGIVSLEILKRIHEAIKLPVPLTRFINVFFGISSGGLITAEMCLNGSSIDQAIQRFGILAKQVFHRRRGVRIPFLPSLLRRWIAHGLRYFFPFPQLAQLIDILLCLPVATIDKKPLERIFTNYNGVGKRPRNQGRSRKRALVGSGTSRVCCAWLLSPKAYLRSYLRRCMLASLFYFELDALPERYGGRLGLDAVFGRRACRKRKSACADTSPRKRRARTRGAGRGKGKEVAYKDSRDAEPGVEPIDEERDGETNGRVRQRQGVRPRSGTTGKSLNKLKSSDDLLGRRMQGLAGGLTGLGEED
ncbi:hypothetical protein HYQ44_000853 [Verticillium longisporum]|nr:hypothetical protein HYQ44_000853 [Verticillium longisporum]